jgi:hypothetical protein
MIGFDNYPKFVENELGFGCNRWGAEVFGGMKARSGINR